MRIFRGIALGIVLAGITFFFTIAALHPYRSVISWAPSNQPERLVAAIFSLLVFVVCVWRVAQGTSASEEGRAFFDAMRDIDID